MIRTGLFVDQEREAKLTKLGDALRVLEQHVDFAALAVELGCAAPRSSRECFGRPVFPTELMVLGISPGCITLDCRADFNILRARLKANSRFSISGSTLMAYGRITVK